VKALKTPAAVAKVETVKKRPYNRRPRQGVLSESISGSLSKKRPAPVRKPRAQAASKTEEAIVTPGGDSTLKKSYSFRGRKCLLPVYHDWDGLEKSDQKPAANPRKRSAPPERRRESKRRRLINHAHEGRDFSPIKKVVSSAEEKLIKEVGSTRDGESIEKVSPAAEGKLIKEDAPIGNGKLIKEVARIGNGEPSKEVAPTVNGEPSKEVTLTVHGETNKEVVLTANEETIRGGSITAESEDIGRSQEESVSEDTGKSNGRSYKRRLSCRLFSGAGYRTRKEKMRASLLNQECKSLCQSQFSYAPVIVHSLDPFHKIA